MEMFPCGAKLAVRTVGWTGRPLSDQVPPRDSSTHPIATCPRALFFDVFGTLVDWRSGVAREAERVLEPLGYSLDWLAFADAWRDQYQPAMDEVRSGRMPFCKLDLLHRRNLERILPRFGVSGLAEAALRDLNLAWHRLDAWPDAAPGLGRLKQRFLVAPVSNGNISLMVDLARRNGFAWDAILGAEMAGDYKPKPRVYLAACEAFDLRAARLRDGGGAQPRPRGGGGVRAAHRAYRAAERARAGPGRGGAERAGGLCGERVAGLGGAVVR